MDLTKLREIAPIIDDIAASKEVVWLNPRLGQDATRTLTEQHIRDASDRLIRFAPLIMKLFPETQPQGGIIESELTEIPEMKALLKEKYNVDLEGGRLFLKRDSDEHGCYKRETNPIWISLNGRLLRREASHLLS